MTFLENDIPSDIKDIMAEQTEVALLSLTTSMAHIFDPAPRKDDSNKVRYDLIPPNALHELASVYTMGAQKYAAHNWLSGNGLQYTRLFNAIMRHCWAWIAGEDLDPESGLHHMAHAAFSCFAIVEYHRLKKGIDDRYDKLQNQTRNEQSETTPEESRRQAQI
jgi:hypothetical protein